MKYFVNNNIYRHKITINHDGLYYESGTQCKVNVVPKNYGVPATQPYKNIKLTLELSNIQTGSKDLRLLTEDRGNNNISPPLQSSIYGSFGSTYSTQDTVTSGTYSNVKLHESDHVFASHDNLYFDQSSVKLVIPNFNVVFGIRLNTIHQIPFGETWKDSHLLKIEGIDEVLDRINEITRGNDQEQDITIKIDLNRMSGNGLANVVNTTIKPKLFIGGNERAILQFIRGVKH